MDIVIVGHVDHGKSSLVGRMLADTDALPEGRMEAVRAHCDAQGKPFEYAFLLDALRDEREQGITIDAARVFFRSKKRAYLLLDAPGHVEFVRNMVTGAARAEAAVLVVDAHEGVRENSRRHAYLLRLLGIEQIAVVVNKMDKVHWDADRFAAVAEEVRSALAALELDAQVILPASAHEGTNVAGPRGRAGWIEGPSLLEALDAFDAEPEAATGPFRMPVQAVYKFAQAGDDRRIVAGTVSSGSVEPGDEVLFYPAAKRSHVSRIESFGAGGNGERAAAHAGEATGFTLTEEIYIPRGALAVRASEPAPHVGRLLRVSLFWLGKRPLDDGRDVVFRTGTAKVEARVERIERVLDASTLIAGEAPKCVARNEAAEVVLRLRRAVACDIASELGPTSRFVLVDDFDISGGGLIREVLPDAAQAARTRVIERNIKWEPSLVSVEDRHRRYGQHAHMVLVSGPVEDPRRKDIAKALEAPPL